MFFFNEENVEIKKANSELTILIDYNNIISYHKNYYGEIGHYYWIELKDEIVYLSFFNHTFAKEIEDQMITKLTYRQ